MNTAAAIELIASITGTPPRLIRDNAFTAGVAVGDARWRGENKNEVARAEILIRAWHANRATAGAAREGKKE